MEELKIFKLTIILLGLISIVISVVLGVYIVRCCLVLAFLDRFLFEANIVAFATAISVASILYGCYSVYKGVFIRGGVCNLGAGVITTGMYLYYAPKLPFFQTLGVSGYSLLLPALTGGVLGVIISKQTHKKAKG